MKKAIICTGIAAAALLMGSCGGKGASETAATDAVEAAAATPAPSAENSTKLNLNLFSVEVPQGWDVDRSSSFNCKLQPRVEPASKHKSLSGWSVDISVWEGDDYTVRNSVDNFLNVNEGAKRLEPVTLDGMTFQRYFFDYQHGRSSLLVAPLPGGKGVVTIEVDGYATDDAAVQKILGSFRLK